MTPDRALEGLSPHEIDLIAAMAAAYPAGLGQGLLYLFTDHRNQDALLKGLMDKGLASLTESGRHRLALDLRPQVDPALQRIMRQRLIKWALRTEKEATGAKRPEMLTPWVEEIEAAIRAALEEGLGEGALDLAIHMLPAAYATGRFDLVERLARTLLPAARLQEKRRYEILLHGGLGDALLSQGRRGEAAVSFIDAVELARTARDLGSECKWLCRLSGVLLDLGKPEEALKAADRAIRLCRDTHLDEDVSACTETAARACDALGRAEDAKGYRLQSKLLAAR